MNTLSKLLFVAAVASAPSLASAADRYAFVDESGVWRPMSEAMDDRYVVFKKLPPPAPEPIAAAEETQLDLTALPAESASVAERRSHYAAIIGTVAREHSVDAALLHAVITVESAYNAKARSPKGASGLMQLMPATAAQYGVKDIWDPGENIRAGARFLRDMMSAFRQDVQLALAAYNAGQGAVIGAGNKIPAYAETRAYVPRVLQLYERYRGALLQ